MAISKAFKALKKNIFQESFTEVFYKLNIILKLNI